MIWSIGSENSFFVDKFEQKSLGMLPFLYDDEGNQIRRTGSFDDEVEISVKPQLKIEGLPPISKVTISSSLAKGRFVIIPTALVYQAASAGFSESDVGKGIIWLSSKIAEAIRVFPEFFVPSRIKPERLTEIVVRFSSPPQWQRLISIYDSGKLIND